MAKTTAIKTKQTAAQIIADIAEATELSKRDVKSVFEATMAHAGRHMKKGGSGEMTIPGMGIKIRRVVKPARKARKGINPFTGEEMMFKAKPASKSVKAVALKKVKELAS